MSKPLPPGIEHVYPTGRDVPDRTLTIGRCGQDHGVAWPSGTLRLHEASCPGHGGYLSQTTRILNRPFWVMTREAARAMAKAVRDADAAEIAERVTGGFSKLARDLVAGDVITTPNWRDGVGRVVSVAQSDRAKTRVAVTYVREHQSVTRSDPSTLGVAHLYRTTEVQLRQPRSLWADEDQPAILARLVAVELRSLTDYARRSDTGGERNRWESDEAYAARMVRREAYLARDAQHRADVAEVAALLGVTAEATP